MTTELEQIYEEILDLHDQSDDLQLLEALANNAIYVLSKMQKNEDGLIFTPKEEKAITRSLTDVLNTLNKEIKWAKEEEALHEQHRWFVKAKKQILEDMVQLFE